MGLFDSLFGGNQIEEAVNRHIQQGGPADRMIRAVFSEMVLIPMSSRCPDQAYLNELVRIMKRRFHHHQLLHDIITLCIHRCAISNAASFARIKDGTPEGRSLLWVDKDVPLVPRTAGGISPKMDRLLRTRILMHPTKGWILTSLYDDGTLMSPSIEGPAGPMGQGGGWKIDVPG
jgi:hypothetical protein